MYFHAGSWFFGGNKMNCLHKFSTILLYNCNTSIVPAKKSAACMEVHVQLYHYICIIVLLSFLYWNLYYTTYCTRTCTTGILKLVGPCCRYKFRINGLSKVRIVWLEAYSCSFLFVFAEVLLPKFCTRKYSLDTDGRGPDQKKWVIIIIINRQLCTQA